MKELKILRKADIPADSPTRSEIDCSSILGVWQNTNSLTNGITQVTLYSQNERLMVSIQGAGATEPIDWGDTQAVPAASDISGKQILAFTAHFDFVFQEVQIIANCKLGTLVISYCCKFKDDSDRQDYYCREFFFRQEPDALSKKNLITTTLQYMKAEDLPDGPLSGEEIKFSDCFGNWQNTLRSTKCIVSFTFTKDRNGYSFRPIMAGSPAEWQPIKIIPFSSDVRSSKGVAFQARYELDFMDCFLSANYNGGLFVIAIGTVYQDHSGRQNQFTREFFCKRNDTI